TATVAADNAEVFEWRATDRAAILAPRTETTEPTLALPGWVGVRAAPPAPAPARITPSSIAADEEPEVWRPSRSEFLERSDPQATAARDRGRLVHRLLQSLPEIAPERRREVAERFVAAFADKVPEAERAAMV